MEMFSNDILNYTQQKKIDYFGNDSTNDDKTTNSVKTALLIIRFLIYLLITGVAVMLSIKCNKDNKNMPMKIVSILMALFFPVLYTCYHIIYHQFMKKECGSGGSGGGSDTSS